MIARFIGGLAHRLSIVNSSRFTRHALDHHGRKFSQCSIRSAETSTTGAPIAPSQMLYDFTNPIFHASLDAQQNKRENELFELVVLLSAAAFTNTHKQISMELEQDSESALAAWARINAIQLSRLQKYSLIQRTSTTSRNEFYETVKDRRIDDFSNYSPVETEARHALKAPLLFDCIKKLVSISQDVTVTNRNRASENESQLPQIKFFRGTRNLVWTDFPVPPEVLTKESFTKYVWDITKHYYGKGWLSFKNGLVEQLLDRMFEDDQDSFATVYTTEAFNYAMSFFMSWSRYRKVRALLATMTRHEIKPNSDTFNIIFSGGYLEKSDQVVIFDRLEIFSSYLDQMIRFGITADENTWISLLKTVTDLHMKLEILRQMRLLGFRISDDVLHSFVIDWTGKIAPGDIAQFVEENCSHVCTTKTMNVVIRALLDEHKVEMAWKFMMNQKKIAGINANTNTLNLFFATVWNMSRPDWMLGIYFAFVYDLKIKPNAYTFHYLIKATLANGFFENVNTVLQMLYAELDRLGFELLPNTQKLITRAEGWFKAFGQAKRLPENYTASLRSPVSKKIIPIVFGTNRVYAYELYSSSPYTLSLQKFMGKPEKALWRACRINLKWTTEPIIFLNHKTHRERYIVARALGTRISPQDVTGVEYPNMRSLVPPHASEHTLVDTRTDDEKISDKDIIKTLIQQSAHIRYQLLLDWKPNRLRQFQMT
ncbi:hypothetical protein V1514DRAFT_183006 [Lipomyces japonicus]|uniref:uncharacterized protein n=1 Tax=Lipomyces japonicus TaxID=56871 RepID=UPI0034CEA441